MSFIQRKRSNEDERPEDAYGSFESSEFNHLLLEANYPTFDHQNAHSLNITDQPESTPTMVQILEWNPARQVNEVREVQRTPTYIMNVKWEIQLPAFTSSRLLELALAGSRKDVFVYVPSENYKERKTTIYVPSSKFSEPVWSDSRHIGGIDPSAARRSRTIKAQSKTLTEIYGLQVSSVNDLGANGLHAVAWLSPDLAGGRTEAPPDIIVGGGQIGAAADEVLSVVSSTGTQFDTNSDIATGLAAGSIITGMIQVGSKTVVVYADNLDPTTATTGGIAVFADGVVTEALLSGVAIANPMYAIAYDAENRRYVAAGKGGEIYAASRSNLTTLSDLTDAAVTANILAIDFRPGKGYLAAENATAYTLTGSLLTAITSAVLDGQTPTSLNSVKFLGNYHVAFGGSAGFYSETLDDANWNASTVNSGAGTVNKIVGTTWRVILGVDSTLLERSVITFDEEYDVPQEMVWRAIELDSGALAGNITDIALLDWMGGPNVMVIVTDQTEIVYAKPGVMQY